MDAIGTKPVRLGNRTYRPGVLSLSYFLKLTPMGRAKRNPTLKLCLTLRVGFRFALPDLRNNATSSFRNGIIYT